MKKILYLLLFLPGLLVAQTETNNTKQLNRAVLNNSRGTNSINQTILKGNNAYDSINALRTSIGAISGFDSTYLYETRLDGMSDSIANAHDSIPILRAVSQEAQDSAAANELRIEASAAWGYPIVEDFNIYDNAISTISNNKAVFSIFAGDFDIYSNSIKVTDQDESMPCFAGGEYDYTWTILRAYNNTIDGPSTIVGFLNGPDTISTSHITLKNNILRNVATDYWDVNEFYRNKIVSDNNMYLDDAAGKWHIGTDSYDFAGWKTATGQDTNSSIDDPLFVDTIDYRLSSGSPAIDAGITDATFNSFGITYYNTPDMGYWQSSYERRLPYTTPTGKLYINSSGKPLYIRE